MARRNTRIFFSVFLALVLANTVWFFFHSSFNGWFGSEKVPANVEKIATIEEVPAATKPLPVKSEAEPQTQMASELGAKKEPERSQTMAPPATSDFSTNEHAAKMIEPAPQIPRSEIPGIYPEQIPRSEIPDIYSDQSSQFDVFEPKIPEPKRLCFQVGPFVDRNQAQPLRKSLQAVGAEVEYEKRTRREDVGFWVFLPRQPSTALGRLKVEELRLKGLDDVVLVPSGESKNMISLGVFKYKKTADERFERAKALGYPVQLDRRIVDEEETWIKTSYLEAAASEVNWKSLMSGFKDVKYLPMLCD